ncbi:MAG: DUF1565 domain-containing protein [Actinomycetota bacterium]
MLPPLPGNSIPVRTAAAGGLVVVVALALIGLLPAGPDREAPPVPQSASRYLRQPDAPFIEVDEAAAAVALAPLPPEEQAFLHTVNPRTFLTPYADSVLIDHPEWICDTPAPADSLYVATDGSDENPGSADEPLATINEAIGRAQPGQHVLVRAGTYDGVLISGRSGEPDAWITLRSYPGERAVIEPNIGQDAIAFRRGSSYINVACFELAGPTLRPEAIPASPSELRDRRRAGTPASEIPQNYGSGVDIGDQADTRAGLISHHVRVIANEIHDFAEMGVSGVGVDHITIAGNVSYRNAKYSCHAGSGIGLGYQIDQGGPDNADGYRNYIVGNVSYDNENWSLQCFTDNLGAILTDGNGIIVDLNNSTDYTGRTLIADNVVFGNGGRGILVFKSDRVDVVNNVTYHNALTEGLMGRDRPHPEIAVADADDVRVYNNIAVPQPGNTAFTESSSGSDVRANVFDLPGELLFVNPTTDVAASDFNLLPEAEELVAGGIPFLATVTPDGEARVGTLAPKGTIYNHGLLG